MLAKLEFAILDRTYAICSKSITTPFKWENGKMSLKLSHSILNTYNWITWILLLLTLFSRCIILPKIIGKGDINGSIIHGILLLYSFAAAQFKLNILLYKADLVQLINHSLHINFGWGMYVILY